MLPFALRVVWFCLSFIGIIASWVVMYVFSRAIGCYWMAVSYCIFATLLEGVFCLGMIYNMDPFQMPKAFCIIQTVIIYYSAYSLTGVCAAFTFATAGSVLWPSLKRYSDASTVAWKNKYYLPIVAFPVACLSIALPILMCTDAIHPSDDLHCDASKPEWGRFLGYAGLPMILTVPCFFISAAAARRVIQTHLKSQRTRLSFRDGGGPLHMPSPQSQNVTWERLPCRDAPSPDAGTPICFSPETAHSPNPKGDGQVASLYVEPDESPPTTFGLSLSQKRSGTWEGMGAVEEDGDEFDPRVQIGDMVLSSTARFTPPSTPNLAPAIWRLILFQMAFFIIQCLAALSTVVDVAQHRPTPTPFGSQHVALVMVGWGPAIVFGHLPAVRRQFMFWKK